ncbi:DNA replication protein DnaC [Melghirimyces profundicolus]|uniref:DNA replication protein DnaC n=1 Tax=Melghirimyces profundicolus TaxID=1242148 RepID=A0A2T6BD27_9BACL|nr:ATP-binding protein [Melghirimyces profundicolus]PTX53967.1 DNA replication protein DnaC [Melghirimyces profundicolus]
MGYITDVTGWKVRGKCECLVRQHTRERLKAAMIPEEFKGASFNRYKRENAVQRAMYDAMVAYLQDFNQIQNTPHNSIGFIARYGEQRLKALRSFEERRQMKTKHNNFGMGKTHLQIAAAKELIKRGKAVLVVSDVMLMEELMQAKRVDGVELNRILGAVIQTPVLVWDDIGKSNPSDPRRSMYFQIIDERYKAQRPILFSSNEDPETLEDRIGHAATSRLFGMARGRVYRVEGPDCRLVGS